MGESVTVKKGDVVVIPFPFTDLTTAKKRPALVLASLIGDDFIAVQITSKGRKDEYSVVVTDEDFSAGTLKQTSNLRPNKLFTLSKQLVLYKVGELSSEKMEETVGKIIEIIKK